MDGRDERSVIGTPGGDAGEFLRDLVSLERLDLGFTHADDQVLLTLSSLPNLLDLDLVACDGFGDPGLIALANAKKLQRLNLELCDGFSPAAQSRVEAALPGCKVLR